MAHCLPTSLATETQHAPSRFQRFFPDQQTTFADQRLPPLEDYFHYVSLFLIDQSLSLMDGLTWRRLDVTLTFPPNARR